MKTLVYALLLVAAGSISPKSSMGQQQGGGNLSQTNRISGLIVEQRAPKRWDIVGKVVTLQGDPVPDAKVRAEMASSEKGQSLTTDSQGNFKTFFEVRAAADTAPSLRLTIRKKGFLTANELIEYRPSGLDETYRVTLRPAQQDEDLLSQQDLIAHLGPLLRELGPSDGLTARAEKDFAQGTADFFNRHDSAQAVESLAKVVKRDSACPKCWTLLALAELDSGDLDGAVRDASVAVSKSQKDSKTGSPEASLLLGVIESWKYNPSGAADYFAEALAGAPKDALALQELGRADLQNRKWASADACLSKALAAGAGPEARLLRVKALLGEGETDQASAEMARYLGNQKLKDTSLRVHMVWDAIQDQKALKEKYAEAQMADSLDYVRGNFPPLTGLEPAKSQKPLQNILSSVGKNVKAFFHDFQNTSSLEEIHEEQINQRGKVISRLDQKYRYLCMLSGADNPPFFQEYRRDLNAGRGEMYALKRGFMLTAGFVSASLNFHPDFQSQSTFRYIGRQKVDGREAYVVAFAQQPLKTKLSGGFKYGIKSAPTYTQGLAWIDAQDYQIIRLRTDLLRPLKEVKLQKQTTEIDYQQVHFKSVRQGFWLPRQVAVTVEWDRKTLHNEHSYSDFELFDVNTHEKIGKPKEAGPVTQDRSGDPTH